MKLQKGRTLTLASAAFLFCLPLLAEELTEKTPYATKCASCHGAEAGGKLELKAPPIAALPVWYTTLQLKKFGDARRGSHPEDMQGKQMIAISQTLSPEEISSIAHFLSELPKLEFPPPEKADPRKGKELFMDRCAECHRFNGSGEKAFGSAPLARFPPWYLQSQFQKFQTGIRGLHSADAEGPKMREVASHPIGADELSDIFAFLATCQ